MSQRHHFYFTLPLSFKRSPALAPNHTPVRAVSHRADDSRYPQAVWSQPSATDEVEALRRHALPEPFQSPQVLL